MGVLATWMIGCAVGCLYGCVSESQKIDVYIENRCKRPITVEAKLGIFKKTIVLDENGTWEGWIYRPTAKGKVRIELLER